MSEPAHGTYAGYQRHRKAGEQPCERCQAANAFYAKERRRRKAAQPVVTAIRAEVLAEAAAAIEARRCGYRDCDECKCRAENAALVRALLDGAQ